jgi:hypothetical protein
MDLRSLGLHVVEANRPAAQDDHGRPTAAVHPSARTDRSVARIGVENGGQHRLVAVAKVQRDQVGLADPPGLLDDHLEHRRRVGGRAADGTEHRRQGRPAVKRLGDLAVALLKLGVAPLQFLEKARVLDRDHGLIGEALQQGDLLVGEGAGLVTKEDECADDAPLAAQRRCHDGAVPETMTQLPARGEIGSRCARQVGDVDGPSFDDGSPRDVIGSKRETDLPRAGLVIQRAIPRGDRQVLGVLDTIDVGVLRLAQPGRALHDRVEHHLEVGWCGRDDPQHLGRRGLLLQRLAQLSVPPLQLLEQPGVLDRDDGLIGERLQHRDLVVAERADFLPADGENADRDAVAPHRDVQPGSCKASAGCRERILGTELVCVRVLVVNDAAFQDRPSGRALPGDRSRVPHDPHGTGHVQDLVRFGDRRRKADHPVLCEPDP